MAEENITLDSNYADLIIEVNSLKDALAEKIAERDMLTFFVLPEIERDYMNNLGYIDGEIFLANLTLEKTNRKIELIKERIKYGLEINEEKVDLQVEEEFKNFELEYLELQDEYLEDTDENEEIAEKMTPDFLKLLNIIYKNLVKQLSPLINPDNTKFLNQLYVLLENAYRVMDLEMLSKIQNLCERLNIDSKYAIGDMNSLKNLKEKYENLITENSEIIFNIKCSEIYGKKKILEDDELFSKTKKSMCDELSEVEKKLDEVLKELENLKK